MPDAPAAHWVTQPPWFTGDEWRFACERGMATAGSHADMDALAKAHELHGCYTQFDHRSEGVWVPRPDLRPTRERATLVLGDGTRHEVVVRRMFGRVQVSFVGDVAEKGCLFY